MFEITILVPVFNYYSFLTYTYNCGVRYHLDMTSKFYFLGGGVGEKLRPGRKTPKTHRSNQVTQIWFKQNSCSLQWVQGDLGCQCHEVGGVPGQEVSSIHLQLEVCWTPCSSLLLQHSAGEALHFSICIICNDDKVLPITVLWSDSVSLPRNLTAIFLLLRNEL